MLVILLGACFLRVFAFLLDEIPKAVGRLVGVLVGVLLGSLDSKYFAFHLFDFIVFLSFRFSEAFELDFLVDVEVVESAGREVALFVGLGEVEGRFGAHPHHPSVLFDLGVLLRGLLVDERTRF